MMFNTLPKKSLIVPDIMQIANVYTRYDKLLYIAISLKGKCITI